MADRKRFTGASGAEYEMSAKPALYPTPTRLRLAANIRDGKVRHYAFATPVTYYKPTETRVTAAVREFVNAGLATYGEPAGYNYDTPDSHNYSIVALTPDGEQWLTQWSTE